MEHKLIQGGEQYLPFARSRIKALRATGLNYASQQFEIDGVSVKVRIQGDHDYIDLKGVSGTFWMMVNLQLNNYSGVPYEVRTRLYKIAIDKAGLATAKLRYSGATIATSSSNIPISSVSAPALLQFFASGNSVAGLAWTPHYSAWVGYPTYQRYYIIQGVGKTDTGYGYQNIQEYLGDPPNYFKLFSDDIPKSVSWGTDLDKKPALVDGKLYYTLATGPGIGAIHTRWKIGLGSGAPELATDWAPVLTTADGYPTGPTVRVDPDPAYSNMDAAKTMQSDKAIWIQDYPGDPQYSITAYSRRGVAGYRFAGTTAPLTDKAFVSRNSSYNIWQWMVNSVSGPTSAQVVDTRDMLDLRTLPGIAGDSEFISALNYTYTPSIPAFPSWQSTSIYEGNAFCYASERNTSSGVGRAVHITMQVDQKGFPDVLVPSTP